MKTESDIRKRIQHHQNVIDYEKKEIGRIVAIGNHNDARVHWGIIGKEQAIIDELKKILEE